MFMKKEQQGILSGGFIAILSFIVYFFLIPTQIKLKKGVEIGPEFFPKIAVMLVAICSLAYVIFQVISLKSTKTSFKEGFSINIKEYKNHLIFISSAILFLAVVEYLGFAISAILLTIFLLFFFGSKGIVKNIVIGIVYGTVVYLLFSQVLRISFPVGIFGI